MPLLTELKFILLYNYKDIAPLGLACCSPVVHDQGRLLPGMVLKKSCINEADLLRY
jgi:hypothetical protein